MGIVLVKLWATGPNLPDAEVNFDSKRQLILGPSDTGKSYIRECLWYMVGGDKPPKWFPLAQGYDELHLRFASDGQDYEILRGIKGGLPTIFRRNQDAEGDDSLEPVDQKLGEFLVELAGASGRVILHSASKKGRVTGDDLRHWALVSQTSIMGEGHTAGTNYAQVPQRIASFNLFLTGQDDAAITIKKSNSEVDRIRGQLTSAEESLSRVKADIDSDVLREDVEKALASVDKNLNELNLQYEARASKLRSVRKEIAHAASELRSWTARRDQSGSMISRFEILEQKYNNDLERLGAAGEGVEFFLELSEIPCPLCGTPPLAQEHVPAQLEKPDSYRKAIAAEAGKISNLRAGLVSALKTERDRFQRFHDQVILKRTDLDRLEQREAAALTGVRIEFSTDPKTLAERRGELSAQLGTLDEIARLEAEITRLKGLKARPKVTVTRDGGTDGRAVADRSKAMLEAWGFSDIKNIALDAAACDLVLNDRPRLSYGAGKRALYLSALTIALMEHALQEGHPHLGAVVIDSPLRAYGDPKLADEGEVPAATVGEKFYGWLAAFQGKGQIIVMENTNVPAIVAKSLPTEEFVGLGGDGRIGFYPYRDLPEGASETTPLDSNDEEA
ncbi:hypothetical protein ACFWP0_07285 [Achromobacter sp. NPDC058515]|uniref:hypothetical protein n=1 Tax=Achromobacter sp. NPDC058515 TaxID=3346533 RepID=UPI00364A4726